MTVSVIIKVKTKKNPKTKEVTSETSCSKSEYPMIMGIRGNTQGDKTEAIPAKNDSKNPISILSLF